MATPEQRKADIFSAAESFINAQSVLQLLNGGEAMALRSALTYKYNPSVRYVLELAPHRAEYLAQLRVSLRTQSPALLLCLDQFYAAWAACEARCLPNKHFAWAAENGRYVRQLRLSPYAADEQTLGDAMARYVSIFDSCMKSYFSYLPDTAAAKNAAMQQYQQLSDEQTNYL